jgi:1-deoxy-D-xylulose-5-phosphate reductoisomerase
VRGVALLGATGSIGAATLNVIRRHSERFRVVALTGHQNAAALDALAREFDPDVAVLSGASHDSFEPGWKGEWRYGESEIVRAANAPDVDIVVNALVGIAGLEATLATLREGRRLALANKESLVAGGELVLEAWRDGGGELIPVDSEHSAIHQCLQGCEPAEVRRLFLTASGGPFRDLPREALRNVQPEDALAHPTWDMGAKITVDSATLANKALEVIEAHYLFGLPFDRIEVVVHPTSVVHSMVEFVDGSTLAQLGHPTMEVPVLWALGFPRRLKDQMPRFDPIAASPLSFESLRVDDFPMFRLGVEAGAEGGKLPIVYNAANEVVVAAFLRGTLSFEDLPSVVEETLSHFSCEPVHGLDDVWQTDSDARRLASTAVESVGRRTGT